MPRHSVGRWLPLPARLVVMALRTYDVFDTVLTRSVGEPTAVFLMLGLRAVGDRLWAGSAEQFARARVEAETRARVHAGSREIEFTEIYAELRSAYALDASVTDRLADLELALERQVLRAVPDIALELAEARRAGDAIQFVSDMYLPHDVLRRWLVELGALKDGERLWVSSAHGATKSGGELFDLVRAAGAADAGAWVHHGDNAHSDVRRAGERGIGTRHYVRCHLTANERTIEQSAGETLGVGSLLAGAARWTRLQRPPGEVDALDDVATGVGAPVIYAFVLWVLLEAQRRGLRRIWFMARDGQVMLPVARAIAARLKMPIEAGYLYGGRQIVRVASLQAIDAQALEWLMGGAGIMTLQAVLDRVGVAVADVRSAAESLGLPTDAVMGWARMPQLQSFLSHPDVAPLILKEAARRREVVLDYFRACGLLDGPACAVVDIGWRGNVLRSVVDLIGSVQASRHTFMYFGSYAHARGCETVPKIAYLFDVRDGRRYGTGDDIPSMTTLMEIFCQADHGQVMRLERVAGGFGPVCRAPEAESSASAWNVARFQAAVAHFAETVAIEQAASHTVDLRGLCDRLLRRLATRPTSAEIALLAPIGFVDDQGGSKPQPFAHAYGWAQIRDAFRSGRAAPSLNLNWWTAAAVSLTPTPVRWCMRAAAKAGKRRQQRNASRREAARAPA